MKVVIEYQDDIPTLKRCIGTFLIALKYWLIYRLERNKK